MLFQHDYTTTSSVVDSIAHSKVCECLECRDVKNKQKSIVHSLSNKETFSSKPCIAKGLSSRPTTTLWSELQAKESLVEVEYQKYLSSEMESKVFIQETPKRKFTPQSRKETTAIIESVKEVTATFDEPSLDRDGKVVKYTAKNRKTGIKEILTAYNSVNASYEDTSVMVGTMTTPIITKERKSPMWKINYSYGRISLIVGGKPIDYCMGKPAVTKQYIPMIPPTWVVKYQHFDSEKFSAEDLEKKGVSNPRHGMSLKGNHNGYSKTAGKPKIESTIVKADNYSAISV